MNKLISPVVNWIHSPRVSQKIEKYWGLFLKPLIEIAFTMVVSNATLILLVFLYMVHTKGADFSIQLVKDVIGKNISSSEILIYLLAIFAPTTWIMFSHWRARKHAPFFFGLLILQGIFIFGSAYIYGASKYGDIANATFADKWAVWCLGIGVIIWYVTLVYRNHLPSLTRHSREPSGSQILDEL